MADKVVALVEECIEAVEIALVRQQLWPYAFSDLSDQHTDTIKIPRAVFERFAATLAYAA